MTCVLEGLGLGLETAFKLVGKDATVFDTSKIRNVLGFSPTEALAES